MFVFNSNISLNMSTFGSRDIVGHVAVRAAIYGILQVVSYNHRLILHGTEIQRLNDFGVAIVTFGVTWRHRSRDRWLYRCSVWLKWRRCCCVLNVVAERRPISDSDISVLAARHEPVQRALPAVNHRRRRTGSSHQSPRVRKYQEHGTL